MKERTGQRDEQYGKDKEMATETAKGRKAWMVDVSWLKTNTPL